jgi:hypothetical protein
MILWHKGHNDPIASGIRSARRFAVMPVVPTLSSMMAEPAPQALRCALTAGDLTGRAEHCGGQYTRCAPSGTERAMATVALKLVSHQRV